MDRMVGILGLLFIVAIAVRVYLVYRENGYLPVVFGNSDSAHDYVHKVLAAVVAFQVINIVAFRLQDLSSYVTSNFLPTLYQYLVPIPALEVPVVQGAGLVIASVGLVWSVISQSQMGKDWRVGIDDKHETSLVTGGLYSAFRHPIYLGFMAVNVGFFLAAPNAVSLVIAVLTVVMLGVEARLEEEFLLSRHGDEYRDYLTRTRRWV